MDEIDDIAQQAKTAMRLREGVPGSQAGDADTRIRLNGGDPATGAALRGQVQDNAALQQRFANAPAPAAPTDIRAVAAQAAQDNAPGQAALQQRLTAGSAPSTAPQTTGAVPPRNVPLNTPATTGDTLRGTRFTTPVTGAGNTAMYAEHAAANAAPAAPAAAAPAAAAATDAAAAAPRTIGSVARNVLGSSAVGAAARAVAPAIEGVQVGQVALDPNAGKRDLIDQTVTGAARLAGAATGARVGGMGGAAIGGMVGGPPGAAIGGAVGAIGGGALGYYGTDKAVRDIRAAIGLGDKTPFERSMERSNAASDPAAQPGASGGPDRPGFAAEHPATVASAGSNAVASPPQSVRTAGAPVAAPSTIAGVAQQPAKNNYELGKNAVEVIQPGGVRFVQTFGADGQSHQVDPNEFYAGRTDELIGSQARIAAASRGAAEREAALSPTEQKIAVENVKETGATARAKIQAATPHVVPPTANHAAGLPGQPSVFDGSVVQGNPDGGAPSITPLGVGKVPFQQRLSQAQAALRDKKTTPEQAASIMEGETGQKGAFTLSADKKTWVWQPATQ